jgi:hypothetical protein
MPLDSVPGESFAVLVDHTDGQRGRSCPRGPPPPSRASSTNKALAPQTGGTPWEHIVF